MVYRQYYVHLLVNYFNQLVLSSQHLFHVIQSEEVVALVGKEECCLRHIGIEGLGGGTAPCNAPPGTVGP